MLPVYETNDMNTQGSAVSGVARISQLGDTGDVARRAHAGMGFLGRGARKSGGELSLPPPPKNLGFARILWPCLSTVGARVPPPCTPPWLRYCPLLREMPSTVQSSLDLFDAILYKHTQKRF